MGKTVLISSHILTELSELCTSIGIIDDGRLVASGSVSQILEKMTHSGMIRIKVLERQDEAVKILLEMPEVSEVSSVSDILEYKRREELFAKVLKELVDKDIPVVSFHPEEGSLESVFMQLTERGQKMRINQSSRKI